MAWEKPSDVKGKIGIKNLRFGKVVTDIVAEDNVCKVRSNLPYTLVVDGKSFLISARNNTINLA